MGAPSPRAAEAPGAEASAAAAAAVRAQFRADKAALLESFAEARASAPAAARLVRQLAQLADTTLGSLWKAARMPESAALLAVGGYGRGELYPYSDVDVLVLLPVNSGAADSGATAAVERFITSCWDAGLEIGSSVRSIAECLDEARRDVTVQTALLESRCLCGAKPTCVALTAAVTGAMDARQFLSAKMAEMRQRHLKYEDTPYSLEPNCKESPGGLRDLQVILWVARAAGLGRNWEIGRASCRERVW